MLGKISRSYAVMQLTRRYFRPSQVPETCNYYINGVQRTVSGQYALTMLMAIVLNDCYGLKRFKSIDNIVDIGANIGVFSVHAATLFPQTKIYAYEPCSQVLPDLEKNLQNLNVEISSYAVGRTTKKVNLTFQEDLTASSILMTGEDSSQKSQCQMIAFDEVTAQLGGSISLLKLDCEGSEYEILKSISLEKVKYVVGEFHTCQSGYPELGLELLKERGFVIDNWTSFPDGKAGEFWASNIRNTPQEKAWLV
ncbi:MAG: FkbM family methyltransferase [Roseofilum sp. Belize BBD 4]|uniref:FkbM family methyltransferase n=1 Tax=Roseofilum sp. Belize BBD 4 TaxID=2821500 RepID=UPI000E87BB28|nr:FkbM family methyltransferase [Roseofilum sp. Belize BBD 4]MBP0032063.1 FkbM family methyltransferase [Roseofilum sp. Belize BBD 4]HBQ98136.1 hypothetical protein [Cyanobacteria bacterium UBA11691]